MRTLAKPKPIMLFVFFIFAFGLTSFFLAPREGEFNASVLTMGLGYTAKALCSCLYVSEQTEDQCREYAAIEQVSPKLLVDRDNKLVISKLLFWSAKAKYLGAEIGCVLD